MMFRSTLFAGLLVCAAAFFCAPVAAADGDGLKPGVLAPPFQLRVVNDDVFVPPVIKTGPLAPKQLRWGPGRWTGDAPDEKKKLVIMSFFATYCAPCKKEMPELSRLYDTYKDQGLGVMLISIDKGKEQLDEIIGLAKENNVSFPVLHDTTQIVGRRYYAERLPYMLMLDPAGTVKVVHTGYTEELKASLENEVRGHLGLPPLPPPAPDKPVEVTPAKGKPAKAPSKAPSKG